MALELLAVWGVAQAAGFLFKPVLEDFAKDVVKDKAKDYVKGCFGNVFKSLHKDTLQKALANALKELLQLLQDELLDAALTEKEVAAWNDDVKEFVRSKGMQAAMRQAFTTSDAAIDAGLLAQAWQEMTGPHPLPNTFDWSRIAKRFSRAVRSLRESDTELRQILQAQAAAESSQAQRQMGALPVDFELESYREALLESHRHLKLELLDTTGASYKVQLNSVFVPQSVRDCQEYVPQYFELPREHKLRLRQSGDLEEDLLRQSEEMIEERRQIYRDQSPRSVWELVNDDRAGNLVILGDPGSGKSTLLKAMALDWAQIKDATGRYTRPLPLLIELGSYDRWECASGKSFVRYLQDAQTTHRLAQDQLDQVLRRRGGAVLLLDGLDEIFDRNRRKDAINSIQEFSNKYRDTRIIVTSRVIGYEQRQLSDAGFNHYMLQDLDEAQIADFLDRWYATFVPDARERKAKQERIANSIRESRAIRELADNPLLLTMMSFLNLHQVLPRDRVKLYERMTEVLLHQWDFERLGIKGVVEYPEKAEMLRRLAHLMQNAPAGLKGNIIAGDELKKIFRKYLQDELGLPNAYEATNKLVEQLRERNFILCHLGADKYAFVHRTFLEYFCAAALVRQALKEDSSLEFLKTEVFGKRWSDESWHEVLRLVAGMDDQVPAEHIVVVINYLLEQSGENFSFHNLFLAADCCREVRNPKVLGESLRKTAAMLEGLVHFDSSVHYRIFAEREQLGAKAVHYLANTLFLENAKEWLQDHAIQDGNGTIRRAAVQEVARGWHDDPETLPWLKACAAHDALISVREAALQEVARGWHNDSTTLPWLQAWAAQDADWQFRLAALRELIHGWHNNHTVLSWLREHIIQDVRPIVRYAAISELSHYGHDDPATLPWLQERVARDPYVAVREVAVERLARGWRGEAATLLLLQERATQDVSSAVREAAIREIERGWKEDLAVREWLQQFGEAD